MIQKRKSADELPPIRVRYEPPTIAEALFAASHLTDDLEQRIEIAAGLMCVSPDEVRPLAIEMERPKAPVVTIASRTTGRQIVVERKVSRVTTQRVR